MTEPVCPYFGTCGGCSCQHISYDIQLENKRKIVRDITGIEEIKVFSDQPFGYRNRMDFIFHPKGVGFRKNGKWNQIIDIEQCPISNPALNKLLLEVRSFFKQVDACDMRKRSGTFKYAIIRTPGHSSSISFVLNEDSSRCTEATEQVELFAKKTSAENIMVTYLPADKDDSTSTEFYVVKGGELLKETFCGKTFYYHIQGFFQNNSAMAEKMHEYVHDLLKQYPTSNAHLLDVYAGVGTFGIINASLFKDVTVIESFAPAVEVAKKNREENNAANVLAKVLDAKQLKKLRLQKPLYVITDPPRTGMHMDAIDEMVEKEAEVIIYISCNPQQLKKELPRFTGYRLKSAALFDFFPQTNHMEIVVELVRNKENSIV
ncbi:23S rRNA (uracil(1939)-C(5))-methyltransferase RlmD [Candidatus Woesearchaeota archaeon]|nr:23S rRNA (uracil(1939)-C(5))-methyltransferase RlmD [Candidatus Woesearchaeota archaeon]